ncbi:acyltransferase family protein [Teichococcus wenyumeiae]|uniref:acyltransferase family protein n=1 Tax=Teichococcus wenyumeiae TaxID=2478470 RepID=UPI001314EA8F|nr:acyltransferase [Pseudoroseomonas wenyumeiae]
MSGIEAGRGIAAVLVILYHTVLHLNQATAVPALKAVLQFGHAGVDFFFVISGFIIFFVHSADIDRPEQIRRYARQRFTRLMPTYWVALALAMVMAALGSHGMPSTATFLRSFTLLPLDGELLVGVAWTLKFEVLFYLIFAVLIVSRHAGLTVLAAWLAGIVTMAGQEGEGLLPAMVFSPYNLEFLFGIAAAWLFRSGAISSPRLVLTLGLGAFGLASGLENMALLDGYGTTARFAYGLPSALIVLGLAEAERRNLLRVPTPLTILGSASYSLYLFHIPCIGVAWQVMLLTKLNLHLPPFPQFVLLALSGILGGLVMWAVVERPLIHMLRQRKRPGLNPLPAG